MNYVVDSPDAAGADGKEECLPEAGRGRALNCHLIKAIDSSHVRRTILTVSKYGYSTHSVTRKSSPKTPRSGLRNTNPTSEALVYAQTNTSDISHPQTG